MKDRDGVDGDTAMKLEMKYIKAFLANDFDTHGVDYGYEKVIK